MTNENDDIRRYREGSMTDTERHALEKKALNDPFLAEALEGAETLSAEELQADIAELSARIQQPARHWLSPVRIAAGIAMAVGASLFYFYNNADTDQLAMEKESASTVVDSLTQSGDTTQQLLTMAEPDEKSATQPAAKPGKSGNADTKKPAEQPAVSAGPAATTSAGEAKVEKAETEDVLLAEEQVAHQAEEKKTAESLSAVEAAGAGADKAKDDGRAEATRSAKKESVAPAAGAARSLVAGDRVVSGKVTSSEDGIPLPGVNVIVKGSAQGTVTDGSGHYKLTLPGDNTKLVFSFIGLQTSEVDAGTRDVVDVKLGEDVAQLSEVVITGYGGKSTIDNDEPVVKMATPVGGVRAYNNYLEKNLRYPKEALESKVRGKVTIKFTVETSGQLSDFNVVRGLGHGCDEEVIRLVKEGPGWNPSVRDDVPIESEVRVRMKFDPEKAGK